MAFGDRGGNGEAQAATTVGTGAGRVSTVETLEDVLGVLGREPGPFVRHFHHAYGHTVRQGR